MPIASSARIQKGRRCFGNNFGRRSQPRSSGSGRFRPTQIVFFVRMRKHPPSRPFARSGFSGIFLPPRKHANAIDNNTAAAQCVVEQWSRPPHQLSRRSALCFALLSLSCTYLLYDVGFILRCARRKKKWVWRGLRQATSILDDAVTTQQVGAKTPKTMMKGKQDCLRLCQDESTHMRHIHTCARCQNHNSLARGGKNNCPYR